MSSFHFYYGITSVGIEDHNMRMEDHPEIMEPYLIGRIFGHMEVAILALEGMPYHPSGVGPYLNPTNEALRAARLARTQLLEFAKMKGYTD